jgi:hypothetical protein
LNVKQLPEIMKSLTVKACSAFDVRDFFVFGGLVLAGYGLYQVIPALSFIACGSFLICLGLGVFVRRPVK